MHIESPHINLQILGRMFGRKSNSPTENKDPNRKTIEFVTAKLACSYMEEAEKFESIVRSGRSSLRQMALSTETHRVLYEEQQDQEKSLEAIRRCSWDTMLDEINFNVDDPQQRRKAQILILTAVKNWWTNQINNPDRAYDTITIGRMRVVALDSEMQRLSNKSTSH